MKTTEKKSLYRLRQVIEFNKKGFITILVLSIVENILIIAMPFIMGLAIDEIIQLIQAKGIVNIHVSEIKNIFFTPTISIIICAIASAGLSYYQEWLMARISEEITLQYRKEVVRKFKTLPMSFFDDHSVGDILTRVTTGLNNLATVLVIEINQFASAIVTTILGFCMLVYINYKLSIISILSILIIFVITNRLANFNKKLADSAQKELGNINSQTEELLSGNIVVKAFNQQNSAKQQFFSANDTHYKAFKRYQFLNFAIYPIVRFLTQLTFIISAVYGSILVLKGTITVGLLQAFLQYVNQISEPLATSSFVINALQASIAAVDRIYEILEFEDEVTDKSNAITLNNPKGIIEFENVNFGYSSDKILMKNVNFKVQEKHTAAIVGPTGAGKSTLINLLMRFYEINSGKIKIDGIDITNIYRSDLRNLFGMVLQNTWLFEGTIADNIAYGRKKASRKDIIEAAKVSQCDHFIRTLPEGYDTIISSEKGGLSQGQQQLITIARIILANPSIVILDEATSSVDTRTEHQIQKAMSAITKGRTSFVIAHRLSTIVNADIILYMENGNIIEKGSHKTLMEFKGKYAELYNSQFKHV
ncbi:ABC transporter ATP-binding protein [Enterococcus faecalis]|uniref:ABC transporter ATP-binding protein n=1 Tax=Enterococcus TaxID=1350 RepID=UPI001A97853E|nr:ABC transporter ATP-binding protein [Enterococcus faecalis]MBO1126609.1 ABC transporter ATP-binding protein [Enterococcus faecalis]